MCADIAQFKNLHQRQKKITSRKRAKIDKFHSWCHSISVSFHHLWNRISHACNDHKKISIYFRLQKKIRSEEDKKCKTRKMCVSHMARWGLCLAQTGTLDSFIYFCFGFLTFLGAFYLFSFRMFFVFEKKFKFLKHLNDKKHFFYH